MEGKIKPEEKYLVAFEGRRDGEESIRSVAPPGSHDDRTAEFSLQLFP